MSKLSEICLDIRYLKIKIKTLQQMYKDDVRFFETYALLLKKENREYKKEAITNRYVEFQQKYLTPVREAKAKLACYPLYFKLLSYIL